jgi:hypothetical protein
LHFDKVVPVQRVCLTTEIGTDPLIHGIQGIAFSLLDYTTMAVPYVLKKRDRVLVLNAANGFHISQALSHGALQIDAVEPHRGVYRVLMRELAGVNDSMMYRREVTLYAC